MREQQKRQNWFKRHKVITGFIVAIVLISIGSTIGSSNSPSTPTASVSSNNSSKAAASTQTATATTPGLNQPANDGKFQFTVTAFKCGITQIEQSDDQYDVATPQGQYCEMSLTVKNISNVSQSFDDGSQYIYDSSNKQYTDDSNGTIAANPSSSQFMTLPTVNPGVSISGVLAFDIPQGVTPTYAMLHDSSLSNGVKVNLN